MIGWRGLRVQIVPPLQPRTEELYPDPVNDNTVWPIHNNKEVDWLACATVSCTPGRLTSATLVLVYLCSSFDIRYCTRHLPSLHPSACYNPFHASSAVLEGSRVGKHLSRRAGFFHTMI